MYKSRGELIKHINPYISNLLVEDGYEVEWYDPLTLLTPDRIDILVKYLYAKSLLNKDNNSFLKDLYLNNIEAFNGFVEGDYSGKVGKFSFLYNFENLLNKILLNGYDDNKVIPLNNEAIPSDGAHRVAIAMALNIKIPTIKLTSNDIRCDFDYFKKRGQKTFELDYLATQYARIKPNTYIVLVWPAAINRDYDIDAILKKFGRIVYKKTILLSKNGLVNLQRVVYKNEPWVGGYYNDFNGVHMKAFHCYAPQSPLRVYLYESTADNVYTKNLVRELFGIGHHSIHINDSHEETVEIADLLFNRNAITYLNGATRKETVKFNALMHTFKNQIAKYDPDEFAVIGGVVPLFGFRDARDLDYITTNHEIQLDCPLGIEEEKNKIHYTKRSIEEMINDPRCFFIVDGLKYVSLEIIKEIKSKRRLHNDTIDLLYINSVSGDKMSFVDRMRVLSLSSLYWKYKRKTRLKVRYFYYKLFK